jgi:cytidine deaminase
MDNEDVKLAKMARENSYSPYSRFKVGAALRTKSGKVYLGCNVENHGIQGVCAERTAFVKAISEGEREFEKITVVGAPEGTEPNEMCMPCGYCRQFMSEFVDRDFKIYAICEDESIKEYKISELLPHLQKISFIY